ncbi:MAG: hypothetical protein K2K80_05590 [Clostridia bacterium]|nr:hypothetical protein [Clostridia bacterium]
MDRLSIAIIVALSVIGVSVIVGVLKNILFHKKANRVKKDSGKVIDLPVVETEISYSGRVVFGSVALNDMSVNITPFKRERPFRKSQIMVKRCDVRSGRYYMVHRKKRALSRANETEIKSYNIKSKYNKYYTNEGKVA